MAKTIFITRASRGFGKIRAEAFLKRGDKVAATARNANSLKELTRLYGDALFPLDATNRDACFATKQKAKEYLVT